MIPEEAPPDGPPGTAETPEPARATGPEPDLDALLAAERVANDYHP